MELALIPNQECKSVIDNIIDNIYLGNYQSHKNFNGSIINLSDYDYTINDKYKLLRPILSRFCEIYISEPMYNGKSINLYQYNLGEKFKMSDIKVYRLEWLKKELQKVLSITSEEELQNFILKLYEKAYNAIDIIKLIEDDLIELSKEKKYELLIAFNKVRKEFRNEKLLLLFIINFVFLDKNVVLENLSFM